MKIIAPLLITALFSLPAMAAPIEDSFCHKKALALGMHRLVGQEFHLFGHQYDGDDDSKQISTAYEINQSNQDEGDFVVNLGRPEKSGLVSTDLDGHFSTPIRIRNPLTCEHVPVPTDRLLTEAGGCRASAVRSALYHAAMNLDVEPGFVGQVTSQAVEKKRDSEWLAIVTIATGSPGDSGYFLPERAKTFTYSVTTKTKGNECVTTRILPN